MKANGRKSAGSLALADASRHLVARVAPSPNMTAMQRRFWVEITNALPADWFSEENKHLLEDYCRTLSTLTYFNSLIDKFEQMDAVGMDTSTSREYKDVVKRRTALVQVQLTQATKLRITQQSRYTGARATNKLDQAPVLGTGSNPWDFGK